MDTELEAIRARLAAISGAHRMTTSVKRIAASDPRIYFQAEAHFFEEWFGYSRCYYPSELRTQGPAGLADDFISAARYELTRGMIQYGQLWLTRHTQGIKLGPIPRTTNDVRGSTPETQSESDCAHVSDDSIVGCNYPNPEGGLRHVTAGWMALAMAASVVGAEIHESAQFGHGVEAHPTAIPTAGPHLEPTELAIIPQLAPPSAPRIVSALATPSLDD